MYRILYLCTYINLFYGIRNACACTSFIQYICTYIYFEICININILRICVFVFVCLRLQEFLGLTNTIPQYSSKFCKFLTDIFIIF